MPGAMPCSRWWGLLETMISMRQTWAQYPKRESGRPPGFDHRGQSNGHAAAAERPFLDRRKASMGYSKPVLPTEQSASLRERLVKELAAIHSDDAAAWAKRNCLLKNRLTAADALIVEERFRARFPQSQRRRAGLPQHPAWHSGRPLSRATNQLAKMVPDTGFIDRDYLTDRLLVTHRLLLHCMKKPSILKVRKILYVIRRGPDPRSSRRDGSWNGRGDAERDAGC